MSLPSISAPNVAPTEPRDGFLRRAGGAYAHVPDAQWQDWRWQVAHRVTRPDALADLLGLDCEARDSLAAGAAVFQLAVTPYYLNLVDPCDPADPVLPQIMPTRAEALAAGGELDPFHEEELTVAPGLVHRYPDRALFVLTNFCSTLCRHCMRKRAWLGPWQVLGEQEIDATLAYIAQHDEIRDVLVSGGDPLNLTAGLLRRVLGGLRRIAHLDVVRVGSRVPVTLPQRIDAEMLDALVSATSVAAAPLYLNTHFNHARELTPEAVAACRRLGQAGLILGNQAVLLRGVNDDAGALLELSRALLRAGVRPYYLHHGDPVAGATHFQVPLDEGKALVRSLYGKITGLGIPRYTVDLPGGGGKVPVDLGFERGRAGRDGVFESPLTGEEVRVADAFGRNPPGNGSPP